MRAARLNAPNDSYLTKCQSCGTSEPDYRFMKLVSNWPGGTGPLRFFQCDSCSGKTIWDGTGRLLRPGRDCAETLWEQTFNSRFEFATLPSVGGNLDVAGADRRLGCSTDKILDYLKLGWISGRKQGQELVVDGASVEAFLDSLVSG